MTTPQDPAPTPIASIFNFFGCPRSRRLTLPTSRSALDSRRLAQGDSEDAPLGARKNLKLRQTQQSPRKSDVLACHKQAMGLNVSSLPRRRRSLSPKAVRHC